MNPSAKKKKIKANYQVYHQGRKKKLTSITLHHSLIISCLWLGAGGLKSLKKEKEIYTVFRALQMKCYTATNTEPMKQNFMLQWSTTNQAA